MDLIIGGAYQGKHEYAAQKYGFTADDFCICKEGESPDFSKPCVDALGTFTLTCIRHGKSPLEELKAHRHQWENTVFLCDDMFCGVVPLSPENRAWRQETGLLCQYLAREAKSVVRIFCGLEQVLK